MAAPSRSPEIEKAPCPACGAEVPLEPEKVVAAEVSCPHCAGKLWFIRVPGRPRLYPVAEVAGDRRRKLPALLGRLYEDMSGQRGPLEPAFYHDVVVDVLDLADLALVLEEEFGFTTSEPLGTGSRSFSELVDRVIRDRPPQE
jgi:DNA-directed RNA polymerase subunit RPC12/RpoP